MSFLERMFGFGKEVLLLTRESGNQPATFITGR